MKNRIYLLSLVSLLIGWQSLYAEQSNSFCTASQFKEGMEQDDVEKMKSIVESCPSFHIDQNFLFGAKTYSPLTYAIEKTISI